MSILSWGSDDEVGGRAVTGRLLEGVPNFGGKRAKPFGKAEALGGAGMSDEVSPDSPQSTTLPGGDEESEAWYDDSYGDGEGGCPDDQKDADGNCPGDPGYDEYSAGDYYGEGEVAPPGREEQVKKLKQDKGVDNPYAVAWASYNKGEREARRVVQSEAVEADAAVVFRRSLREAAASIDLAVTDTDVRQAWDASHPSDPALGQVPGGTNGWVASVLVTESAVIVNRMGKNYRIPYAIAGDEVSFDDAAAVEVRRKDFWPPASRPAAEAEDAAGTDHEFPAPVDAWRTSEGNGRRAKQGEVPPGIMSGDPILSPTLSEDAEDEAGTSDGAKKGWERRKRGGDPAPAATPEQIGAERRAFAKRSKAARLSSHKKRKMDVGGTISAKAERQRRVAALDKMFAAKYANVGRQAEGEDAEGRYVAQAEAIGAGAMGPLMRKGARVPALKTDRGGVEKIPLASLKDDIRRKSSLRKMMSPDKQDPERGTKKPPEAGPEAKRASESVRAFEEAYA